VRDDCLAERLLDHLAVSSVWRKPPRRAQAVRPLGYCRWCASMVMGSCG